MMPGETHSAAPGTAADLSRCQGCASLQQNLNEYVEALITLKQKIINTDNLLTEYQKKCDELQFARRENSTLHHQVEQMLQKISPLQKCQEELGSLKAELEEKKSSLKLYQNTHQEYARVKEECLKTDAQKKKLEAKVKKLEEAAVKQTQDFKQLRNEKKILEKEFKKTQERLDEFSKQKNEKELRHIGTQISSDSYGSIDKRKVKLLLKELWLCVNTTRRLPGEGRGCVPEKSAIENPRAIEPGGDGAPPPAGAGPLGTSAVQTCLAELSTEVEGRFPPREGPGGAASRDGGGFKEDRNPGALPQRNDSSADVPDHDRCFDEDLQAAVDFFKLPPPLLSPVPSPPLVSPHPGALRSSLVSEAYFEECTDSSDNDVAPHRVSAESVSEDDAPESRDSFNSPGKSKGSGPWEERLRSHEATQAPNALEVSEVTAVGLGTFTATLGEPSATVSFAREERWAVSSEFMSRRGRGVLGEVTRQREGREMDWSVHPEKTHHNPPGSERVEKLLGSLAREEGAALGTAGLRRSPLGSRLWNEPSTSGGNTLGPRVLGSPTPGWTKWTLADGVPSQPGRLSVSGRPQGLCRGLEEQREGSRELVSGVAPAPGAAGAALLAAGLGVEDEVSSSSASIASSLCGHLGSPCDLEDVDDTCLPTEVDLPELRPSEQRLQAATLNTFQVRPEPPECPRGDGALENSFRAFSPVSRAPDFHGQRSDEVGCATLLKGTNEVCSLPQLGFMGAMRGGLCESRSPRAALTPSRSDLTLLAGPQSGSMGSGLGFVKNTSWRHNDLLRRSGTERLSASPEHEQARRQLQEVVSPPENRTSASEPERTAEGRSPVAFRATAPLLPNQVSVITKQTRPETTQSAGWEPMRPARTEPPLAADAAGGAGRVSPRARRGGSELTAQESREAAATERTSPGVSTSLRKLDFNSLSGSLPVENPCCPANSKLSFTSENIPVPNQDMVTEARGQEEVQKQSPHLPAPSVDSPRLDVQKIPAAEVTLSRAFPGREIPTGDAVRSGGEAPAVSKDPPAVRHCPQESLPAQTPGGASPDGVGAADPAFSPVFGRRGEEKCSVPQSSLPGTLCCYTGIREVAGGDTEVEESEAPSCSEGENEPEAAVEQGRPELAAPGAAAAVPRPSTEVGYLTSALRDFNISALSEMDRLSTSEVVMFLESCQLRDYSSGDSVSECSSKGTRNKGLNNELKQSEPSGDTYGKQLCEEETLETSEEWVESEEEDGPLRSPSRLAQCSLETLSEVLTRMGRELQTPCEDADEGDAAEVLLLNVHDSVTAEHEEEPVPPQETASLSPQPSAAPPPGAGSDSSGPSPTSGGADHKNARGRSEGHLDVIRSVDGGEEVPPEPTDPLLLCADSGAGEGEAAFQCQISTVTSEIINVLINKDHNLVIEKGDNWTIINGVALMPNVDQVILCDALEDAPVSPDPEGQGAGFISVPSAEQSPETGHPGPPFPELQGGSHVPGTQEDISSSGQNTNFDKSRLRNRPVKPSVRISSEIYDQNFDSQTVQSDHTYYNSKLEPFSKNKNRSKVSNKDQSNKPVKTSASSRVETTQSEDAPPFSGERGNAKAPRSQTQTILANADTSTPADCGAETLSKIRQEVGPPLPPLLAPLIATPPRASLPASPLISSSSPSSPLSPAGQASPLAEIPAPPVMSPLPEEPGRPSPPRTSPSPSTALASERVLSSPLQFCAATPKHALPVPGRLPAFAPAHPVAAAPSENSVKILDTMYPELSARARTLSILKGNVQLARGPPADGRSGPGPVSAIAGFKAITSASTAFVKTGGSAGADCKYGQPRDVGQDSGGKRTLSAPSLRSAKRLRLDGVSPEPEPTAEGVSGDPREDLSQAEAVRTEEESSLPAASTASQSRVCGEHLQKACDERSREGRCL